jgi:hypothetical protein
VSDEWLDSTRVSSNILLSHAPKKPAWKLSPFTWSTLSPFLSTLLATLFDFKKHRNARYPRFNDFVKYFTALARQRPGLNICAQHLNSAVAVQVDL